MYDYVVLLRSLYIIYTLPANSIYVFCYDDHNTFGVTLYVNASCKNAIAAILLFICTKTRDDLITAPPINIQLVSAQDCWSRFFFAIRSHVEVGMCCGGDGGGGCRRFIFLLLAALQFYCEVDGVHSLVYASVYRIFLIVCPYV